MSENFDEEGTELEAIVPTDWQENPDFIENIQDDGLKKLAIEMNRIWKNLTRKFSKDKAEIEAKSSMIYLEHPFVVPGGRFREGDQKHAPFFWPFFGQEHFFYLVRSLNFVIFLTPFREVYYWDSYWTVKGLLLCKMFQTTKELVGKWL